jgi:hypothetical protein
MNLILHTGPLSADKESDSDHQEKERLSQFRIQTNVPTDRKDNRQKKKAPETEFRKPFSFLAP